MSLTPVSCVKRRRVRPLCSQLPSVIFVFVPDASYRQATEVHAVIPPRDFLLSKLSKDWRNCPSLCPLVLSENCPPSPEPFLAFQPRLSCCGSPTPLSRPFRVSVLERGCATCRHRCPSQSHQTPPCCPPPSLFLEARRSPQMCHCPSAPSGPAWSPPRSGLCRDARHHEAPFSRHRLVALFRLCPRLVAPRHPHLQLP